MIEGLSEKFMPILETLIKEVYEISWMGLISSLAIAGILMMLGNEFGAKKTIKAGVYGYIIITIASLLAG